MEFAALRLTAEAPRNLRWTRDLHRFKGNLLFADGHVAADKSAAFAFVSTGDAGQAPASAASVPPSVDGPETLGATPSSGGGDLGDPSASASNPAAIVQTVGFALAGLPGGNPAVLTGIGHSRPFQPLPPGVENAEGNPTEQATHVPRAAAKSFLRSTNTNTAHSPRVSSGQPAAGPVAVAATAHPSPNFCYLTLLLLLLVLVLLGLLAVLALRRTFRGKLSSTNTGPQAAAADDSLPVPED
jgi:prepilin-type processing-associated H-X9-DG protein